jgi:hypothetical protein
MPFRQGPAFSYPNYRDLQSGTADIFSNLAASSVDFIGLSKGEGAEQGPRTAAV